MREHILSELPEITLLANNRFTAEISESEYAASLYKEFFLGHSRVQGQRTAVSQLQSSQDIVTPWLVVSVYYSLLFCAIELLRASGTWISFFSSEDAGSIKNAASLSEFSLEKGTYIGRAGYEPAAGGIKIDYHRSSKGFHDLCFLHLSELVRRNLRNLPNDKHLSRIADILSGNGDWEAPNTLRNRWNYRDAELYLPDGKGQLLGTEFCKLVGNQDSCFKWARRRRSRNNQQAVAALAFAECYLYLAINDSSRSILNHQDVQM